LAVAAVCRTAVDGVFAVGVLHVSAGTRRGSLRYYVLFVRAAEILGFWYRVTFWIGRVPEIVAWVVGVHVPAVALNPWTALSARIILTHPVTAVLALVAANVVAACLGRWATFLPTAHIAFWAALLARAHTATNAGILATGLGTGGPAADIGLLATGRRGTAAFARRGAILTATLAAGH
jgi:hypothetical protein